MTAPALMVATTLLVGLASCAQLGGPARLSKADYEQQVRALYDPVQTAFRETRGLDGPALANQIAAAQAALRRAGTELAALRPPEDIDDEHRQLAEGLRAYAEILGDAHRAAAGGDRTTLARFEDAASTPAVQHIAAAARSMKAKGYALGGLTERRW